MFRKYNIYDAMLRAAAGEGTGGAADDDADAAAAVSANAPAVNAGDLDPDVAPKPKPEEAETEEEAGSEEVAAEDAEDEQPPKPKPKAMVPRDIMARRVRELTRDKRRLEEELAAERNSKMAAGTDAEMEGDDGQGDGPQRFQFKTQAEFDAAVQREARRRAEIDDFNRQCDAVADVGETVYKETWNDAVANLRMLGDGENIPLPLLNAALAADDPAKALHALGQDPVEAERILRLPPYRQVAEVVKHGLKPVAVKPKKRSNTPPPIEPLDGAGGASADDGLGDNVSDADWMKNRQKQVDENARRARSQ